MNICRKEITFIAFLMKTTITKVLLPWLISPGNFRLRIRKKKKKKIPWNNILTDPSKSTSEEFRKASKSLSPSHAKTRNNKKAQTRPIRSYRFCEWKRPLWHPDAWTHKCKQLLSSMWLLHVLSTELRSQSIPIKSIKTFMCSAMF